MDPPSARAFAATLGAAGLILFGWSLWRGQDVNWDLQNYHAYDALALLGGREQADVAPAGPQSFLNPLPYLLPWLARRLLPPRPAGMLVTASQLVPVMLAWGIAWRAGAGRAGQAWAAFLAAIAACTGAVVLTEAGTSFCDLVLAAPALLGVLLMLPRCGRPAGGRRLLLAGLSVGVAIGLKPTGLFLLPALAAAGLSSGVATAGGRLRAAATACAGTVLGALLSDGAWALLLWREYGSPVFPFLNTLFGSASAAADDFADPRYHWQGVRHALWLPFALAGGSTAASEVAMRDPRLAMALVLCVPVLGGGLGGGSGRADPLRQLCVWLLVGTAGWLLLCPIQRYAVVLEMLSATVLVLAAARAPAGPARLLAPGLLLLLLGAGTRPADFFHRDWPGLSPRVPAGVPAGASYGLLTQPLGYWVTVRPRPAHAFTLLPALLPPGGVLAGRLDDILRHAGDGLWLLQFDVQPDPAVRGEMARRGLVLAPPCLRAPSLFWADTVFCRGRRPGPRAEAASDLAPGRQVAFTTTGDGLIYEAIGWDATGTLLTWATAHEARLAFHPVPADAASGPLALTLELSGMVGLPPRHVTARAGGGVAADWMLVPGPSLHRLCVGPERLAGDVVAVRFETPDIRSPREQGLGGETRHLAFGLLDMTLGPAAGGECGRGR